MKVWIIKSTTGYQVYGDAELALEAFTKIDKEFEPEIFPAVVIDRDERF